MHSVLHILHSHDAPQRSASAISSKSYHHILPTDQAFLFFWISCPAVHWFLVLELMGFSTGFKTIQNHSNLIQKPMHHDDATNNDVHDVHSSCHKIEMASSSWGSFHPFKLQCVKWPGPLHVWAFSTSIWHFTAKTIQSNYSVSRNGPSLAADGTVTTANWSSITPLQNSNALNAQTLVPTSSHHAIQSSIDLPLRYLWLRLPIHLRSPISPLCLLSIEYYQMKAHYVDVWRSWLIPLVTTKISQTMMVYLLFPGL